MHENHTAKSREQVAHEEAMSKERGQFAHTNNGRPAVHSMSAPGGQRFNERGRPAGGGGGFHGGGGHGGGGHGGGGRR